MLYTNCENSGIQMAEATNTLQMRFVKVLCNCGDHLFRLWIFNEELMQYLMTDLHQRFIGALNYNKPLSVGDVFRADNTKSYTVVSINATRNQSKDVKSVTVIPVREPVAAH